MELLPLGRRTARRVTGGRWEAARVLNRDLSGWYVGEHACGLEALHFECTHFSVGLCYCHGNICKQIHSCHHWTIWPLW